MSYFYRRRENPLESLLRWRRNVFLQAPGGGYVLVAATQHFITQHYFDGSLRGDPRQTEYSDQFPPQLFDGNGWNLALLRQLIQPERTIMPDNQPFTAFYSQALRQAIVQMTDLELRLFVAIATYIGETGTCFPGVRELADTTGRGTDEVSAGLDSLKAKGLMYYLRYNERDELTHRILPNVVTLTPQIFSHNRDSGIHAYMLKFLNPNLSGQTAQAPPRSTSNEVPSAKHLQEAPPPTTTSEAKDGLGRLDAGASGKDYANQSGDSRSEAGNAKDKNPDLATPAAQPPDQRAAQPKTSPGSAPPPPPADLGALAAYAEPLAAADLEAVANELYNGVTGLQIAKARQLVAAYGVEQARTALALYGKQPMGSVENPAGWLITKLRQRALVPAVDGARNLGKYDDFIER